MSQALLDNAGNFKDMIEALVQAKQHGLLDYPEAREILLVAFEAVDVALKRRSSGRT